MPLELLQCAVVQSSVNLEVEPCSSVVLVAVPVAAAEEADASVVLAVAGPSAAAEEVQYSPQLKSLPEPTEHPHSVQMMIQSLQCLQSSLD